MRLIDADALISELNDSHFPGAPYVDAGINIAIGKVLDAPTIETELPKQFMSDDCISRSELYKKVCEAEELARALNPAYTRYSTQLSERTQFKYMIADARSVQPDIIRCKDCAKRKYCRTSTVWAVPPDDDWYCGDAERRTDETD